MQLVFSALTCLYHEGAT